MQFYRKFLFDSLRSDINCEIMLLPTLFCGDLLCYVVERNPVPKSQTKPFYIGTKEAPSGVAAHILKQKSVFAQYLFSVHGTNNKKTSSEISSPCQSSECIVH